MKLAFCVYKYFPFGGLQRDFRHIIECCLQRGHRIDIYALEWHGERIENTNLTIINPFSLTNHQKYWRFANIVKKQLDKNQYDKVIGFNKMFSLDFYYAADPCYVAKVDNLSHPLYKYTRRYKILSQLEAAVFSPISKCHILHLTNLQKKEFTQSYHTPEDHFHLLPPGIAKDRIPGSDVDLIRKGLRAEFKIEDNTKILLMIGSGFKTKGLDRALKAVAALPNELRNDLRFMVIGQDKGESFIKLAESLGIEKQFQLLSGRTDIPRFLFAADAMIHPAYSENTGTVLLEAIVAGLPVLATDVCGYAHRITDAKAGLVCPSPFKQETLNQLLQELLTSPERDNWKMNGLAYGQNEALYDMPSFVTDLIEQQNPTELKYLNNFDKIMALEGKVYRQVPNRKVISFSIEDNNHSQTYFAKLHYGVGWREIIKNLIQCKLPVLSAKQEWQAIEKFNYLDIPTMTLVKYGERGCNIAKRQSYIITKALENTISLEDYCANWPTQKPVFNHKLDLLKIIAKISATMHNHGMNHRDYYLCHFLLDQTNLQTVYLIDLHRAQIRKKLPLRWRVKDIAGLYFSAMDIALTKRDKLRFIKYYSGASLKENFSNNKKFWEAVDLQARQLYQKAKRKNILKYNNNNGGQTHV